MANKRTLKRSVNSICEELFAECIAASLYGNEQQSDNADAVLFSILKTQRNYIARVSHPEPGISAKAYFHDLRTKFAAEVSELVDHISSL
ncbi:MAG: hypothetical protein IKI19_04285 [Prevotella sp.]|jgi:hypothetical protein|nr:hypothetical protein [Prevotella sp.]MBR6998004.1 hypothetical protein [Prevotella sp.]